MENLLGKTYNQLIDFILKLDEKKFRVQQLFQWIHQKGCLDFDKMTDISVSLRDKLKQKANLNLMQIINSEKSIDGTIKLAFDAGNNNIVESVIIPDGNRYTLCISSQIGCPLDCGFCATGKQGYYDNLTTAQIISQVWTAVHYLKKKELNTIYNHKTYKNQLNNVVFMGMGEPLLNFEAVMNACDILLDDLAYGLAKRKVTISTAGIIPSIEKMCGRTEVALSISLHAPNDIIRSSIMSINKKYNIEKLLNACTKYLKTLRDNRFITFEYVTLKGINDSVKDAYELAKLVSNIPCKINIIPMNEHEWSNYSCSTETSIDKFQQILQNKGYVTTVRRTRGDNINAACGQLVGKIISRSKQIQ